MFINFPNVFNSIHREKMEQILQAYGLPTKKKKRYSYNDPLPKGMACLPYDETNFFKIVTGVFRSEILALYKFIICIDNIFRKSIDLIKENGFTQK